MKSHKEKFGVFIWYNSRNAMPERLEWDLVDWLIVNYVMDDWYDLFCKAHSLPAQIRR